ncbi:unnamed protein product [Cercopithifilaria johnstoni]|uniref:Uncharacterized protein n=1 Tax=Cercopithifilaria johnstoni TaxID=2874296 RepID=A0A8J2M271_9BILA|nr:unnamed protein product [Cercopithifilaria johnstoni]
MSNHIISYHDTGIRRPIICEQSINRPESVIQLARKFAEASAVQDKRIYISNQKLLANGENLATTIATTYSSDVANNQTQKDIHSSHNHSILFDTFNKKPGGIACLCKFHYYSSMKM